MICLSHILVSGAALELGTRESRASSRRSCRDFVVAEEMGYGQRRKYIVVLHARCYCTDGEGEEWEV